MVKNTLISIMDKYINLLYISFYRNIFISFINKFIYKLLNINKKCLNIKVNYNTIYSQFVKTITRTIKFLNSIYYVNIIINRIRYNSLLIENKLIIKIGNMNNVIVYIPDINNITLFLSKKNDLISLSGKNNNYITGLSSLIKNIKKIDKCTGIGMYYKNEKVLFKRKIINDVKK